MTPVLLTIDTEYAWRHHAAGLDAAAIHQRSIEPGGVGLTYQLERLGEAGLKACFFVDPMPALVFGLAAIRRIVEPILAAGQEVQLHCHPAWTGARLGDHGHAHARFNLPEYAAADQAALIAGARDLLMAAGAPAPVAFRAGAYMADAATLAALAPLGIAYDSSGNAAVDGSLAPSAAAARDVVEVPVTTILDLPGRLRPFQLCALSSAESEQALLHAARCGHAAVTIVSHSFELANRAGTAVNALHVRRFEALCATLAARRDTLPTVHFADRPALAAGRGDEPLPANRLRTHWRQTQQLWSNWVAERAA